MAADAVAASTGFSCSCFHLAFSVKTCGLVQAPKILVIKWKVGSGWGYRHSVFVLVVVSPTMLLPKLCSYRHLSHTLCFLCLWALRPYLNNCWWNSYPPSYIHQGVAGCTSKSYDMSHVLQSRPLVLVDVVATPLSRAISYKLYRYTSTCNW